MIYLFSVNQFFGQNRSTDDTKNVYLLHVKQGDSLVLRGETRLAILQYREALKLDSSDPLVIKKYLRYLHQQSSCTPMEELYENLVEIGTRYMKHQKPDSAKRYFLAALEIYPFKEIPKIWLKEIYSREK